MLDFDPLVDRIYEAALVPTLWPDVLEAVSAPLGGRGAFLFAVRDTYVSAIATRSMGDIYDQFMREGWATRDPRMGRSIALAHPGFVTDQDLLTDDEIATNEVYEKFYRKHGIGFVAGTLIPVPSGDSIAFAFQRHQDMGAVPRDHVAFLDTLRPHLARSSLMANRLGFDRARAQAAALQAVGLPATVLRGKGRVFAANPLFEALMPSLFQDRADRLRVMDAAADALLADAFVAMGGAHHHGVRSIAVGASDDRVPMVIHLVPIRGTAHDVFTQATALLVVTPVDRAAVPTADVLQGLFDLTPAEARVARGIGAAQSIGDVAISQGVSRETIRSQLKAVLAKTGLRRQSELVSLFAGAGRIG